MVLIQKSPVRIIVLRTPVDTPQLTPAAPVTVANSSSSLSVNNVQGSNSGGSKSSSTNTNTNAIPIAHAGPNQKVHTSDHVILDGSKSSDRSSGSLKFSWLQLTGGQVISLSNQDKAKATFVAPTVTAPTVLTFQLIVNNGNAYSAPSYVAVTGTTIVNNRNIECWTENSFRRLRPVN